MGIKKYFSFKRITAFGLWLFILVLLPPFLIYINLIPKGAAFIPLLLIGVLFFVIAFDKASFRIGVILAIVFSVFFLYKPPFLSLLIEGLNNRMQDAFFQLRGPNKHTDQVVIVDIDNKSLKNVGQWPWPRSLTAKVVQSLKNDGALVVGFDVVFAEPGRYSLKDLALMLQEIGLQINFKGEELEKSEELIKEEEWAFFIEGEKLKEIVLNSWENRFITEDPSLSLEFMSSEEREQAIIALFIEQDKRVWTIDQLYFSERDKSLGKEYQHKNYVPPENPLLKMTKQESRLYFIDVDLEKGVLPSKVKLIIDNDQFLAESFDSEDVVAGGYFILGGSLPSSELLEDSQPSEGMVLFSEIKDSEKIFPQSLVAREQVTNNKKLQESIHYQGIFNVIPDKSGAARFYSIFMKAPIFEETLVLKEELLNKTNLDPFDLDNYQVKMMSNIFTYPSIALEMFRVGNGYNNLQSIIQKNGQKGLLLQKNNSLEETHFIPLDFKGDLRINYLGYGGKWNPDSQSDARYYFPYVSLSDVLYERFPPGTFKDKYVIIGSTDPTLQDLVGSPFRAAFPGLEVHAVMLDNLLSEDYLLDLGDLSTLYIFIGLLLGGTLLSALIAYANSWLTVLFLFFVLTGMPTLSFYSFSEWNVIIDFIYPWIGVILIAVLVILANVFIEGREKRFLNATFKSYLSPELIDRMVDSGKMPTLGGQESVITAYFTDIVSFSTFTEKLNSPKRLVELLNEYLTAMTDILMSCGGTLDKYEGDAIIAFFGEPVPLENHVISAMTCGIRMQKKLEELRSKWSSEGDKWPEVIHHMRMRIGINSGCIVTGNMGSSQRMNYTMMGDAVNLAARLESAAKQYGVFTLCSEETSKMCEEKFILRHIDKLRVVGRSNPVDVYEVLDEIALVTPEIEKLIELFHSGLSFYFKTEWDQAIQIFKKTIELEPYHPNKALGCKTTPSHLFIDRCENYKKHPPMSEGVVWDGVYTATEK
jgi:class 3 adenylate cyclase/CHASE2 domain-containing sensor protein